MTSMSTKETEPFTKDTESALNEGLIRPPGKPPPAVKSKVLPQVVAGIIISLGYFNVGAVIGWTGSALLKLEADYHMGPAELALVVSSITVGSMVSSIFAGKIADILGRKKTITGAGPVLIGGWLAIGCSSTINGVYVGRFLCGLASGLMLVPCQVFSSEISEKCLRGRLASLQTLSLTIGLCMTYTAAGYLPWRISCFCFVGTAVLMTITVMCIPESPYWLLLKNRRNESSKSLQTLRGKHFDVEPELREIELKINSLGEDSSFRELFKRRTAFPLAVSLYVHSIQQFTGGNIIMMFTSMIFQQAKSNISPELGTVLTGLIQLLGVSISFLLVDKAGRRTLLAVSSTSVGLVMLCLATYFHHSSSTSEVSGWIPLAAILTIVFCYCLGCRSIPWIMSPELFNTSIRSRACSIGVVYNRTLNFVIIQVYPYIREAAGNHTVFYIFGTFGVVMGLLALYILPETKNKTLEEIQDFFEEKAAVSKSKRNSSKAKGEIV